MLVILVMLFSLILMVFGAELLVLGASRLAAMFGVSELVIGLTIVAVGTSAPELVVSIQGLLTNHSDLVVGNCIGSNIFNILFIIGLCAAIAPLVVVRQLIRLDVPIMIGGNLLFLLLSIDGKIDRFDGLILLAGFAVYYWFVVSKSLKENSSIAENNQQTSSNVGSSKLFAILKQIVLITFGLILCIVSAGWLIDASVKLARILGVGELVIGLTVLSAGTSLPEIATSIVATVRGKRDIAIGNVIGSCIFNVLGVIGLASLIPSEGIQIAPSVLRFDLPVMIVTSLACLPIFFTDYKISRWEGLLFLFYYGAYTSYLLLEAHQHDALPMFSTVMLWFVIPLSSITLLVLIYRTLSLNFKTPRKE
jgi:cation:H+ antiporter